MINPETASVHRLGFRPADGVFMLALLWLLLAVIVLLRPALELFWWLLGIMAAGVLLFDWWRLRRSTLPDVQRHLNYSLALDSWHTVKLQLHNPAATACHCVIFDDQPADCEINGQPQTLMLPPYHTVQLTYQLRPLQRGNRYFQGVYLQVRSPWRGWWQSYLLPVTDSMRVYPNFHTVTGYSLLATTNRLGHLGIRKLQQRGEGLEFHQLREYRAGDALRQIDWKTSARHQRLISREYQDERDQRILFLLDCGRRMLARDGNLSHFDHTLNAMLLLSWVALQQGDALGLMTFGSNTSRWLAPRKGHQTVNNLLNSIYDLQPENQPSDYLAAAEHLLKYQQKRALIVLVSNLRDEDSSELKNALKLLSRRHLVLLASLREMVLHQTLHQPVNDFDDALRHAVIHDYLTCRTQHHKCYQQPGVICLDVTPEQLPVQMVNRYLDIKRGGQL